MIRDRFGEAQLCQFPDERCDEPRDSGTGYCVSHIGEMRRRASVQRDEEQPDAFEFCAVDICDGQADGTKEAA